MPKTQEQIHFNMQRVKCKDSEIEFLLRKALWQKGLRYRKNVKSIFGHPDIAFIGKKIAVFCDSDFGTVMIGNGGKKISRSDKTFGFRKSSAT